MLTVKIDGFRKTLHNLLEDPRLCLRELLQNAFEAISLRQAKDSSIKPEIKVSLVGNVLSIQDNGIGMNKAKMEKVLSHLFDSDWDREEGDVGIGQFGLGIKTCLLITEDLRIESRAMDSDEAYLWHLNTQTEDIVFKASSRDIGTTISLTLNIVEVDDETVNGMELLGTADKLQTAIRQYADFMACPIFLEGSQVNLGAHLWHEVDYEPEEWFQDNISDEHSPLATFILPPDENNGLAAMLIAVPKEFDETPKITFYRQGLLVGKMDADDVFPPFGYRLVGVVECATFDLYVDRNRIKQNDRFKQVKKRLEARLVETLSEFAQDKPAKFNDMIRAAEARMKHGLYVNDELRQNVADVVRMREVGGRWRALGDIKQQLEHAEYQAIFYTTNHHAEQALLAIYRDLQIPVILATLVPDGEHNIDVMLLKEFGKDNKMEVLRVDEGLDKVLQESDSDKARRLSQRLERLVSKHEAVVVMEEHRVQDAILLRASTRQIEDETSSSHKERMMKEKLREELGELGSLFLDAIEDDDSDGDSGLAGLLSRRDAKNKSIFFFNLANPVVTYLAECDEEDLFTAIAHLLLLDAIGRKGQALKPEQAALHSQSLMYLIQKVTQA